MSFTNSGMFFVLLTIFFWGITPIFDKISIKNIDMFIALAVRTSIIVVILWIYIFFAGKIIELKKVTALNYVTLGVSGLFAGLLGMLTYFAALKLMDSSKVVPLASTYPLITFFLAVLILREPFTIYKFLGIIFIVSGIFFINK
jgi:bacterial/archaeal transporter family protein